MGKKKLNFDPESIRVERTPVDDLPMPTDGKPLDRPSDGGKGDHVRPYSYDKWAEGYDRIKW